MLISFSEPLHKRAERADYFAGIKGVTHVWHD